MIVRKITHNFYGYPYFFLKLLHNSIKIIIIRILKPQRNQAHIISIFNINILRKYVKTNATCNIITFEVPN